MEKRKRKTSIFKKIIIGIVGSFVILFILGNLFPINYFQKGKEYYAEKKYEKAIKYLSKVDKEDENYSATLDLIKQIKPIVDSLKILKKEKEELEEKQKITRERNDEERLSYKIIKEKENVNPEVGFNKCNIEIKLNNKITNEELTVIAKTIRKTRKSYDKLWIFYYLPNMKIGSGAWATTHFTPNLEVSILGSTIDQDKITKDKINNIRNVIGKWQEEQYTSTKVTIYKEENKTFIKTIYKNSQESIEELTSKKINSKTKFEEINNLHGEYYMLEPNGDLGYYNKENKKYTVGKRID
ncbi:MAG: hypothetical protein ACPGTG_04905 [Flavobacteriales bacterium]